MDEAASWTVTLRYGGADSIAFPARADRSVVWSAAAAGYDLTIGCLQGRCAICRARLMAGKVAALRRRSKHALAVPTSRADGCVLLCAVRPRSELLLEALSPWQIRAPAAALAPGRP